MHAPKTCENFIGLVKKGFYDGIAFHRIIAVRIRDFVLYVEFHDSGRRSNWNRPIFRINLGVGSCEFDSFIVILLKMKLLGNCVLRERELWQWFVILCVMMYRPIQVPIQMDVSFS